MYELTIKIQMKNKNKKIVDQALKEFCDKIPNIEKIESEIVKQPNNDLVEIICYGEKETRRRKEALDFYYDCMMNSDGSERDRYTNIYLQLKAGLKKCSDEED